MTASNTNRALRGLAILAAAQLGSVTSLRAADEVAAVASVDDESLFDSHLVGASRMAGICAPVPLCPPCPPSPCPPNVLQPDQVFQPTPSPMVGQPAQQPQSSFNNSQSMASLQAGQGALTGQDYVPAFAGDFFAGPSTTITSDIPGGGVVAIPRGNSVGLTKMAENASPLPRDRFFVSYNYFDNVSLIPGGLDVHRITPGVEKTFLDGAMSLELRVPMAFTLNSTTQFDPGPFTSIYDTNNYELGNVTGFFKALLYQNEVWALSTGVGVALPTADDIRVVSSVDRTTFDLIKNESVHILPFIGSVYTPNDRWFFQQMLQFDVATRGNDVYAFDTVGNGLIHEGRLDDPSFVFFSMSGGYWAYIADDPSAAISRVGLITELHNNFSLGRTDQVNGQEAQFSNAARIQSMNALVGANMLIDQNKSLMLGYVAPIGNGADRAFDGELRLMLNWYFGGPMNRATRAQF